jgi:hypothetical protein
LSALQVLHIQSELAKAGHVGRIGEEVGVGAHSQRPEGEEFVAFRQDIGVEDDLLGRTVDAAPPAVDGVILPASVRL